MPLPTQLIELFNHQRRRLRRLLWWETFARVVAAVVAALGVGLLLDWWLEPPPAVRQVALLAGGLCVLVWVARSSLEPLLRPITNRQVASLIEQREPALGDALLSSVELDAGANRPGYSAELIGATSSRALGVIERRGVPAVFSARRAQRWTRYALLGVLAAAGFIVAYPSAAAVFGRRLALSPEPWPRRVVLSLVGLEQESDGVWRRRIARGESIELAVRAELTGGHECPETVWLRYGFANGARGKESFAKVGDATTGADAHQLFRYTLSDVRSDVDLRVYAGDGRVGPVQVVVAPRPVVTSSEVEVRPPPYLGRAPRRRPAEALEAVPEGSAVAVYFVASKPLARVEAEWAGRDGPPLTVALEPGEQRFWVEAPPLAVDRVLRVRLIDTDGIASEAPHPTPLAVKPDTLPRVQLRLVGIGPVVTPDATIKLELDVEDDHRVDAATIDIAIDGVAATPRPIAAVGASPRVVSAEPTIDLLTERFASGLDAGRLQPGQRLTLAAAAEDLYDLKAESRRAESQRFRLEVVTADQLLAQIEQREYNLRQTFEQTVADARKLERLLSDQRSTAPAGGGEEAPDGTDGQADPPRAVSAAAGPKTDAAARLQATRLADAATKLCQETLSVGQRFRAIHDELVNNRIQNSDLLDRINGRIAGPLLRLGEKDLPRLTRAIRESAPDSPTDDAPAAGLAAAAVAEMDRVLEQMKSLETYNEVLAMLRQVIDEQQRVRRATEKTRRDQVRRLLLE